MAFGRVCSICSFRSCHPALSQRGNTVSTFMLQLNEFSPEFVKEVSSMLDEDSDGKVRM